MAADSISITSTYDLSCDESNSQKEEEHKIFVISNASELNIHADLNQNENLTRNTLTILLRTP